MPMSVNHSGIVRDRVENRPMGQNFLACDREQPFLLPPDVREWLPEGHLAWFVIDAVAVMDLAAFYGAYREDGHGRAAYEPSVIVALLLYCWSRGIRSSRRIERAWVEDVACRVIAAHQRPDHATIARFVERHEVALGDLFGAVLALCAEAGLASVGVVAIDGTKIHANASRDRTMDYEQIAREIVAEAIETDVVETAAHGDRRGDELPRRAGQSARSSRLAARGGSALGPATRLGSAAGRALARAPIVGGQAPPGRGTPPPGRTFALRCRPTARAPEPGASRNAVRATTTRSAGER
jgi:transposase